RGRRPHGHGRRAARSGRAAAGLERGGARPVRAPGRAGCGRTASGTASRFRRPSGRSAVRAPGTAERRARVVRAARRPAGPGRGQDVTAPHVARLRVPRINVKTTKIPLETVDLIKEDVAKRLRFLPLDEFGDILVVVTPDIFNVEAVHELRKSTGRRIALIQC